MAGFFVASAFCRLPQEARRAYLVPNSSRGDFMLYLIALIIPPLALLLAGKPFQAILSAIIWILAWVLAIFGAGFIMWLILAVWAIMVVRDRNTRRMMEDIRSDDIKDRFQ